MSKKNNKKNSTRKNYKIESLEPRLMMDAAANDWINEMQTVEQSFDSVDGSIVTNMDLDIEGLSRQPDKSLEYNRAPIKFNEVFNVVDEIKKSADYKNVQSFINTCIESCREDVCSSEIADVVSAQGKLDAARQENPVDPSKIALAEQELHDAENVRDKALNEAKISANQLLAKLKTVSGNWSFAKNGADSILVSVTTTLDQKGSWKSDNVNPDIGTQTRLGVQFDDRYDRTAVYSWSFTIDGNKSTAMDLNIHSDMSLGFRQNLTDKEAELGVLKLTSKPDVDENDADYQVNASLDAGENVQTTFTPSYNVDLNFKLNNSNQLEKDLSLNAPSDMVLSGTSLASATWGSDDNLLRKIKYVQMGDILNKLNDMCYELSTMVRDDSCTLFDNSDLNEALDQKTKTLIAFSKMFDPILKIPPQSLQELMTRLKAKAEVVVENGEYVLKIPFSLSSSLLSKVSFNDEFLQKLIAGQTSGYFDSTNGFRFDVTEKNSLDYTNDSSLSFDMKLTLTDLPTQLVSDTTTLKGYLKYDAADTEGIEKRLSLYGKSYVAEGDYLVLDESKITEDVEIEISHATSTVKATVNKGTEYNSSIGQAIVNKLKTIDSKAKCYSSNSIFAFVSKLNDVHMAVTGGNARQVGIYGNRPFEESYLFELSAGAKVIVDSKQMDVPKDPTQFQKFALQMQNQLGAGYKVVYVEDAANPAILIQLVNDTLKFSNFSGGVVINSLILYRNQDDQTAFSIDPSLSSFKFTIDLTNPVDDVVAGSSVSSFELSFESSDFEKCLVIDDVADVINSKLARYQDSTTKKQVVFAEIIQDDTNEKRLAFRCDNQSIDVTASEDVFGYSKGMTVSSSSNSICLTVLGKEYKISLYDSLNVNLEDSKGNALTIRGLLEIIKQKMKTEHSVELTIDVDGLSFEEVTEIKDLDAFTLVKSLGLHEYVTGSRPLEDVKTSVDLSNINLTMNNQVVQGKVIAHANMGMLGIDYSGKVDFTAKYENRAADWDEFVYGTKKAWSYTSNAANTIEVNLSETIDGSKPCGSIEIIDASNNWSGRVSKSPLVNNLNSSFGSDMNMAMFATSLADGLQKFLDNKIVGNAELKTLLPLIGRSAPEVFGIQSKVTEFVSELKRNLPVTLQELSARLSASLGATLTFSVESDGINASFDWKKNLNHEKITISTLSLGNSDIFVGGNAEAYLDGKIGLTLNMKVGTVKGADGILPVTFLDGSKVNFDVNLKGNPLKFDLSVSTASASVSLLKVVSTNEDVSFLNLKANMEMNLDESSQNLKKNSEDFRIGGKLYVEAAGFGIGYIDIGVYDKDSNVESWSGSDDKGKFKLADLVNTSVRSNLVAEDTTKIVAGNPVLDMSKVNFDPSNNTIFQKLRLVSDGLGSVLRRAQLCASNVFVSEALRKIPLIGDNIMVAADCLTDLEKNFIEPVRQYFYGDHQFSAATVAEYLYDLLKGCDCLKEVGSTCSEDNPVYWAGTSFDKSFTRDKAKECIQYNETKDRAEWRFCIGGEYTLMDGRGGFDIGYPGLGLRADGGIVSRFEWKWNIGFGVSKEDGAYILFSNGTEDGDSITKGTADGFKSKNKKDEDVISGDDIRFSITLEKGGKYNGIRGSLGFLNAEVGLTELSSTLILGIDLNDGQNGSKSVDDDELTDTDDLCPEKIKISDIGRALSIETNFTGDADFKADIEVGLDLTSTGISIGFPKIKSGFEMKWVANYGDLAGKLQTLGFTGIRLDIASFGTRVLKPMLGKIQKVVEPLQPLIDFLNMDVPVLDKLPLGAKHMKMLDIIKSFAKGKCDLSFLGDVVNIANFISNVSKIEKLDEIPIGSLSFIDDSGNYDSNALSGVTGLDVNAYLDKSLGFLKSSHSKEMDDAENKRKEVFGEVDSEGYGWDIPLMSHPVDSVIKLFLGKQDLNLITYRMHPLIFNTKWDKNFPIVGPLCADIGFSFGADIKLAFGYDVVGLLNWKNSGFKDVMALVDGFYIDDRDASGVDVAEVVFHSGITAGASVAGIAGVNVGVNLCLNLNFDDPNNDGKIRLQELARNLSLNPMTIFDASVTMEAEAFAYINYFIGREEFDLWKSGAIELFNTDRGDADEPILVSEQDGDIYVNIGDFAAKRNKGDLSDGDDHLFVSSNAKNELTVKWQLGSGKVIEKTAKIGSGKTLYVYAGKGIDVVTFDGTANFNIYIDGGDDGDHIDLSGMTLNESYTAIVKGGFGIDTILGTSGKGSCFLFGETGFTVKDDKEKVKSAYYYPASYDLTMGSATGTVSGNFITSNGSGLNVIFGGAGKDTIVGGAGNDVIFGDGGHYDVGSKTAKRYDIYETGDSDKIFGGDGDDLIFGGAGDDYIRGGKGDDTIHGGLGNDTIAGDEDDDKLYGYDGIDVIFGDGFNESALTSTFPNGYGPDDFSRSMPNFGFSYTKFNGSTSAGIVNEPAAASKTFGNDWIEGNDGSDVIFGDSGDANGGIDRIFGGSGNDLIDGDGGNDNIDGGIGEDVIYGGRGNDVLDGGADNDIVFGDDGIDGYTFKGDVDDTGLYTASGDDNQKRIFGQQMGMFAAKFAVGWNAKADGNGGNDVIYAGNGSDIVDGQSGTDSYKIKVMDNGNLGYTNVMDTGVNDLADSMVIDGTVDADNFLVRASNANLGFVAKLPGEGPNDQIQRINFWKTDAGARGVDSVALNTGAGDDRIAIDGTISAISVDAGAGNDNITVGQMFNSERTSGADAKVLPKDVFDTTFTTKGYLSNGVQHSTNIEGGEGNDVFSVLHNDAAVSLSGGTGNDTFNVAMFQKIDRVTKTKSFVENSPVTMIGGSGIDRMNIVGSDGDDNFILRDGKVSGNGLDVQTVSVENKNIYGSDGDDSFYVMDTAAGEVTKLMGNNGNDSFYNGGAGKSKIPTVTGNSRNSDPDAIAVQFYTPGSSDPKDTAVSAVSEDYNGGSLASKVYNYQVNLNKAPEDGEIVCLTIFAPGETTEKTNRGDKGIWLVDPNDNDKLCKSITIKFAKNASAGIAAYNAKVDVKIVAFEDSVQEGNDYFSLLHNLVVENKTSTYRDCKNAIVFLNDAPLTSRSNTVTNQFCVTQEHVVSAEESNKSFDIKLRTNPSKVECWYLKDGALVPVDATKMTLKGDVLTVNVDANAVGNRYYISYANDKINVENESVIQMRYSTTGMTELLTVESNDSKKTYKICAETQIDQYKDDSDVLYYYKTAGTQLIIYSIATGKKFALNGTVSLPSTVDVFVPDEPDVLNAPANGASSSNGKNTIEFIKGPLYEDGAGREANLGLGNPLMLKYNDGKGFDEKNEVSAEFKAVLDAAAAAAAKFDEGNCKDRVFTNNHENEKEGVENTLQALESVGKFDERLIAAGADSAEVVNSDDALVMQADTEFYDSDKHSLRFDHKDANAEDENQLTLANMEYGEINLGLAKDQVDIHKSIYREDNFQTYTVVNSGKGGDNVNIHSYAEESVKVIATMGEDLKETTYTGSLQNVVAYSVSNFKLAANVESTILSDIRDANASAAASDLLKRNRVFLNVEYSDGTVQRREVVLDEYDGKAVTTLILKRKLTPVAKGVTIKSVYLSNSYAGDGALVVNAQEGDDTINAHEIDQNTGKSKISREGLVVIGGVGNDTIDVGTNAIAFGDRGQVVYENEKGEIVTVLGSSLDLTNPLESDLDKLYDADYTTPAEKIDATTGKANSNYYQTDGVVRDPKYIHSVSEGVGGNDVIKTHGDKNVVIGGAGEDIIHLDGSNNVALGDNGEVKFAGSDAFGDKTDRVYGDSTKTYLNYVQTTSDTLGGKDEITTGNGNNVVMGGTASDKIATGYGNDIIIGDGGEAYVDRNREALFVNNQGRNIKTLDDGSTAEDGSAGSDVIKTKGGDNVIFGGLNYQSRNFDFVENEAESKWETVNAAENNEDLIVSGSGKDVVFGDNAYATFKGNSAMANGMQNQPTVYEESTISFNFQGDAQNGFEANDSVGAPGYESKNWVNIKGSLASTYGNDDSEIVRFDNGTRASAISLSYNGNEDLRFSSSDNAINLQTYNHWLSNRDQDNAAKLMNSGLMSTAPNNQNGNKVNVAIDGLAQYYESYKVVVYLDLPDANSWEHQSVRIVSLFIDGKREQAYYVNDPAPENFKGSFENHAVRAILNSDGSIKGVKRIKDKDGVEVETVEPIDDEFGRAMLYSNYVVFDVGANIASDRIVIRVEDGIQDPNYNGKDIPGIAAIQIKGVHHKQDVAATTNIDFGGRDVILSGRGDDIVAGGTDADTIETFGDDHRGIDDNDIVFGDNAKMVFVDRDNNVETASMISSAESIAVKNLGVSYNDVIDTGDGNDTVVGGVGQDTIHSGATAAAEDMQDGVKALSINFTRDDADDSMKIREATYETKIVEGEVKFVYDGHGKKVIKTSGETAGVVADNDWHNMYVKNRELHEFADYSSHTVDGVDVAISSYENPWQEYWADNASMTNNISDELDGDTSNSKLYHNYLAAQKQEEIKLTLDHLDTFRSHNGLKSGAYCDLYVYLGGDNNDVHIYDHIYDISLTWYDKSGNKCKTEHRFLNDWTGYNFDGDYKEAYCTSYTEAVDMLHKDSAVCVRIIGNYVVFHNISVDKVDVRIKNVYTHTRGNQNPNENGEQNPKNLPLINAVQIVAGSGKEDAAIGGDHDKDLVFGDDAKLTFDIDVPYAVDEKMADYKNRVVEAESVAIADNVVKKLSTDDIIDTGKDRDVVVGGEGSDNITTGSGDDIAIGGSANLMVEHNNPLGVFTPSVEIVLDQHTIDTNNHQGYLDRHCNNPQEAEQVVRDFQGMLDQGQIKGIQIIDNKNDRLNTFDLGEERDLQSTGSNDPSELVNQNDDEEQNGNQGSENPVINEDDQIDYDKTVISPVACAQLNLVANEKVKLVLESYPKSDDYTPNLWVFVSPQVPGQSFEDVCIELYSDGKLFSYDIEGGFWKSQDVPDHIDGDPTFKDGNCVVYVSSKVNTNVTVQVTEGG